MFEFMHFFVHTYGNMAIITQCTCNTYFGGKSYVMLFPLLPLEAYYLPIMPFIMTCDMWHVLVFPTLYLVNELFFFFNRVEV
jgi:hypothetical protein